MYLIALQNIKPFFTSGEKYFVVDNYDEGFIVYDDDNEPHFLSEEFAKEMFSKADIEKTA